VEGTEVDTPAGLRLRGEDAGDGLAVLRKGDRARRCRLDLVHQRHAARIEAVSGRTQQALSLFAPLGPTYERTAAVLSFGQDPRWRRFLVSRVPPGSHVLDVATGTGAVAKELLARSCTVVGLDQSPDMLAEARRRLDGRLELVEASAESLPFPDASFDALTFTYLLRYVDEPGTTLRELARVVRPGGTVASLEFGLPGGLVRPAWELWTRLGLPLAGRAISPGWHAVGRFLNGSIRDFHERLPLPAQVELWRAAGLEDVHVRRMSLGGGVVMWARRA
jgi:demethylmenaquinone methyltransferase/2-methoxy-6-polyprenyl-1,4-benzoquinol methylase